MSNEIVTPAFDVVDKQVRDVIERRDVKGRDGTVKREVHLLMKTDMDKIYKSHNIPVSILKAAKEVDNLVIQSMGEYLAEKLADKVEELKAAGATAEELKETCVTGKITRVGSNVKMKAAAYATYPNPRDPESGKTETACVVTARIASSHDLRHIANSAYAERVRKSLGMPALSK